MDLPDFSRKGGQQRSPAKTAANRQKIATFWEQVRAGKLPPPRRHRNHPDEIRALAARYIWWQSPEEALALPLRVVAQVMDLGGLHDYEIIERYFGRQQMRDALRRAQPGWFRDRSWHYWHYRLGLTRWGGDVSPLPRREFNA